MGQIKEIYLSMKFLSEFHKSQLKSTVDSIDECQNQSTEDKLKENADHREK